MINLAICISSLRAGGAEKLVVDLLKKFDLDKYDITLIIIESKYHTFLEAEVSKLDIKVIYLNKQEGFSFKTILKLNKIYKNIKPNIIFAHLGGAIYSLYYKLFRKTILIHTIHSDPKFEYQGFKKSIFKLLYKFNIIKPIAVSNEIASSLKREYCLNKDIKIINNGVDLSIFTTNDLRSEVKVIGHVGRFVDVKNHITIIKTFNELLKLYPDLKLILVGDGPLFADIQTLTLDLNINQNIEFIGYCKDVKKYLEKIDIFILPSIYEGLPLSLIESLACGCVAVCSNVGGVSDIIDNSCGVLIDDPYNYLAFSERISELILDKDKYYYMQKESIKKASAYSIDETYRQYDILFQDIGKRLWKTF